MERLGYRNGTNPAIRNHKFFERIDWVKLEDRRVAPPFKPNVVSGHLNSLDQSQAECCWWRGGGGGGVGKLSDREMIKRVQEIIHCENTLQHSCWRNYEQKDQRTKWNKISEVVRGNWGIAPKNSCKEKLKKKGKDNLRCQGHTELRTKNIERGENISWPTRP